MAFQVLADCMDPRIEPSAAFVQHTCTYPAAWCWFTDSPHRSHVRSWHTSRSDNSGGLFDVCKDAGQRAGSCSGAVHGGVPNWQYVQ